MLSNRKLHFQGLAVAAAIVTAPLALASRTISTPLRLYAAGDSTAVQVTGRRLPVTLPGSIASSWVPNANNVAGFQVDWEGTSFTIELTDATFLGIVISDNSGGSRWGVFLDNSGSVPGEAPIPLPADFNTTCESANIGPVAEGARVQDPNPNGYSVPGIRVATFATTPYQTTYHLMSGGSLKPAHENMSTRVRVVLLTEPSFIRDGPDAALAVAGFVTDGMPTPPAPLPASILARRSILALGDSLTAGFGAGSDSPPLNASNPAAGAFACGAGVMVNDQTSTYEARMCAALGSLECQTVAVSGITLVANRPNLPQIFEDSTLANIPGPAFNASNFTTTGGFLPAAILINLGENDCHAWNCSTNPTGPNSHWPEYVSAYTAFVDYLAAQYRAAAAVAGTAYTAVAPGRPVGPTFFLTIGPHEAGQSYGIAQVMTALQGKYDVFFLNATVPSLAPGCGGHPGPTIHAASAARALPVVQAAMGWW